MFKRILVVIDPARHLEPAMDYVIQMVKRWDSSVVALYTAFEEAAPFKATYSGSVSSAKFVGDKAVVMDNNRVDKLIWIDKQDFIRRWRGYGGVAFTPVYTPDPPRPWSG